MGFLGLLPTAENIINGNQIDFRELPRIFCGNRRIPWTIVVFSSNFLADIGLEVMQVGFGNLSGAMVRHIFINHRHRRFCQNAE